MRDILLLPFTVSVIIPWWLYHHRQAMLFNLWLRALGVLLLASGLSLFMWTVILFWRWEKGHWLHGCRHKALSFGGLIGTAATQ